MRYSVTILPIFTEFIVAAFVLLAAHDLATFLVEFQFDAFLLAFLALLLVTGFLFLSAGSLEDLRLHLEKLIQGNAVLSVLIIFLFDDFLRFFLSRSGLFNP